MGVSGLLPLLKSIQKPTELKKCKGDTLGVDAYGWLHRAAFSCAVELGQGKPTKRYVTAAMHRVKMLQHFGVKPYMVFDGDFLPSKAATEDSRAKKRDEKKKLANDLMKAGKASLAAQEFQKCIDITPEMASTLIQQLKKMDIPYVVAPYEADAQLVYLERHGFIDGILSDDSDLLVFGAKRLLTKLDQYGNCIEINRRDFGACREVSLVGWSDANFRRMAIMSGCDYLNGLQGVGLKTAYRLLRKSKTPERVVKMLQFDGKRVSENYLTQFYQAELTFLHQWVFCPAKKQLVHLTELEENRTAEEMPFIGSYVEPETARAIASGDLDPITRVRIIIPTTPSKRSFSASNSPAVTTQQSSKKPINSYFKNRSRVPMGEMDPNCFSVDAQRVAQLTDGGRVPRVFPLPRPYIESRSQSTPSGAMNQTPLQRRRSPRLQRNRTEPMSAMLSKMSGDSIVSGKTLFSPLVGASKKGTPQSEPPSRPQKKARLCGETDATDGSPKNSRFFSAKPKAQERSSGNKQAYLLSDDSIEEALQHLPDVESWSQCKQTKKPLTIFSEEGQETSTQTTTQTSISDSISQEVSVHLSPDSSFEAPMAPPKSIIPLSQKPANTPARFSLNRFSYSSRRTETPASAMSVQSSIFSAASTPSTAPSTARSRLTPLASLGAKALNMPQSPRPLQPRRISSGANKSLLSMPVNPSFVPLPKVNLDEVEALHKPCGSEDQIIPDSDGDEDDLEDAKMHPPTKKLDLSRFTLR